MVFSAKEKTFYHSSVLRKVPISVMQNFNLFLIFFFNFLIFFFLCLFRQSRDKPKYQSSNSRMKQTSILNTRAWRLLLSATTISRVSQTLDCPGPFSKGHLSNLNAMVVAWKTNRPFPGPFALQAAAPRGGMRTADTVVCRANTTSVFELDLLCFQ